MSYYCIGLPSFFSCWICSRYSCVEVNILYSDGICKENMKLKTCKFRICILFDWYPHVQALLISFCFYLLSTLSPLFSHSITLSSYGSNFQFYDWLFHMVIPKSLIQYVTPNLVINLCAHMHACRYIYILWSYCSYFVMPFGYITFEGWVIMDKSDRQYEDWKWLS